MPVAFARIIEGLRRLPSPPDILFGGLGEPLAHPNIVEMVRQTKSHRFVRGADYERDAPR